MDWRILSRGAVLWLVMTVLLGAGAANSQTPPAASSGPPAVSPQFGDFQLGDVHVSLHGALSMGTALRAVNPDPLFITVANGKALGLPATGSNHNGDDAELNYGHAGDIYSSPLQGWMSLSATYNQYGFFAMGKGWADFTELYSDVPWGNYPNGLRGGRPLSDSGFESRAKFSGLALQEAYVFGAQPIEGHNVYFRIGNQYIPWGIPSLFLGALDVLNPIDYPALARPGATYADSLIPVPAVFVRIAATPKLSVEAFWQFAQARNAYPGCGTLFAVDYYPQGCDFALVASPLITDRAALLGGAYVTRAGTPNNNEVDQGGIATRYTIDALNSVLGLYYAHYNSRSAIPEVSRTLSLSTAVPFIPGNPLGDNPMYRTVFPPNIDMFAINWQTTFPTKTQLAFEYVFRPNQPIALPAGEELTAAVTSIGPSLLRADINALAPGQFYQGYDREATGALNMTASQQFANVLGAQQGVVGVDLGVRSVYNLPNPNVRRYGRPDTFGPAPILGFCPPAAPGVTYIGCTLAGFVTPEAVGARFRAQLTYQIPHIPGLVLVTSLVYGRDFYGWSYDGSINEGRNIALARLHFDYKNTYFTDFAVAGNWGGTYNVARDRSVVTLQGGVKF